MSTAEPLFSSVEPVFEVEGQVREELTQDVMRLEVEEGMDGLRALSLRLRATSRGAGSSSEPLFYLDGAIIDFGKRLNVSIGPVGLARTVFKGVISALEATFAETVEPQVLVFAEDSFMTLRMTRRTRMYQNMTDADIASTIAGEHGIAADVQADGPTYDVVHQWNISDLAFLRERARLIQAEVFLQNDTLHFKSRGNRSGTELTLVRGNELIEVQLRADLAHQRTKIHVSGYDARDRDVIDEEAGADVIQAEVAGGRTGPEILERAFGERVSYRVREAPLQDTEARAWARAEMLDRCRGFVTIVGTTRGSPDMIVGSKLTLERVGAPFSGAGYYVTAVRHTYDRENGHRTHFQAERATLGDAA